MIRTTMKPICALCILLLSVLAGCQGSRVSVNAPVARQAARDSQRLVRLHYDSVRLVSERYRDYRRARADTALRCLPDTVVLREVTTEYRYRLLRDTAWRHTTDTVPVVHEVTVRRDVPYVPRYVAWLCVMGAAALLSGVGYLLIQLSRLR